MYLLSAFRLSTYLTLLLACVALGYSEIGLLPEIPLLMTFSVMLLIVGFALEGRWALSLGAANIVGGFLTAILGVWAAYQFVRPSTGLTDQIPFPVRLLPYLGPVLMILIPAKLFRPKLHADYWAMHGIGILAVSLGCAMAHDGVFGCLLIVYLFAFVWSMTLFYLGRCAGVIETEAGKASPETGAQYRWLLFRTTGRWTLLVVGVGLPLFWITPRPADNRWELPYASRGRMETGINTGDVDLNRTGSVDDNNEVAFEIYAENRAGNPKTDLDLNQLWRVTSLHHYEKGRWLHDRTTGLNLQNLSAAKSGAAEGQANAEQPLSMRFPQLPEFGPHQYYLAFALRRRTAETKPLINPVYWEAGQPPPVVVLDGGRVTPVIQLRDGSFDWQMSRKNRLGQISHVQTAVPTENPNLGPVMYLINQHFADPLTRIPDGSRMTRWTTELLERLSREGKLDPKAMTELDTIARKPLAKYHAEIARVLENYLALSKEYRYSLKLQREDRSLDPIEDFLFNTKTGHCQRYASALALMLRSQGIPSRFVLGFKGFDSREPGNYVVSQNQAHAWVEALIPDDSGAKMLRESYSAALGAPGGLAAMRALKARIRPAYRWLTLDPTPASDDAADEEKSLVGWVERTLSEASEWFKRTIVGTGEQQREQTVRAIFARMSEGAVQVLEGEILWPWCAIALGLSFWLVRRCRVLRRRSIPNRSPPIAFQARLWAILARSGFRIGIGQTPREFAHLVGESLARHSETRRVADVPEKITEAYYRVGYGGTTANDVEQREIDERLGALESALGAVQGLSLFDLANLGRVKYSGQRPSRFHGVAHEFVHAF